MRTLYLVLKPAFLLFLVLSLIVCKMKTVAGNVPFYQFCAVLEKINKKQGNNNKKTVLSEFISDWRKYHAQLHENQTTVRRTQGRCL